MLESLFNKLQVVSLADLFKRDSITCFFPVKFVKFLRTSLLKNICNCFCQLKSIELIITIFAYFCLIQYLRQTQPLQTKKLKFCSLTFPVYGKIASILGQQCCFLKSDLFCASQKPVSFQKWMISTCKSVSCAYSEKVN